MAIQDDEIPEIGQEDENPNQNKQVVEDSTTEPQPEIQEEQNINDNDNDNNDNNNDDDEEMPDISDSSEEEESDMDQYLSDGFVVQEGEETSEEEISEKASKSHRRKSKRKKHRRLSIELDDDDYNLIKENDLKIPNAIPQVRKRMKKGNKRENTMQTMDELEQDLFPEYHDFHHLEDPEDQLRDYNQQNQSMRVGEDGEDEEEEIREEDDEENFLVDDINDREDYDYDGSSARQVRATAMVPTLSRAYKEIKDIFGDADDLMAQFEAQQKEKEVNVNLKEKNMTGVSLSSSRLVPESLTKIGLFPEDNKISELDIPERYHMKWKDLEDIENIDYTEGTNWIYNELFGPNRIEDTYYKIVSKGILEIDGPDPDLDYYGKDEDHPCSGHRVLRRARDAEAIELWKNDIDAQMNLRKSINTVMRLIFTEKEEIPHMASYRKQVLGELLCIEETDETQHFTTKEEYNELSSDNPLYFPPGTIQVHHITLKDWQLLWTIYEKSIEWKQTENLRKSKLDYYLNIWTTLDASNHYYKLYSELIARYSEHINEDEIRQLEKTFDFVTELAHRDGYIPKDDYDNKYSKSSALCESFKYRTKSLKTILDELALKDSVAENLSNEENESNVITKYNTPFNKYLELFINKEQQYDNVSKIRSIVKNVILLEMINSLKLKREALDIFLKYCSVITNPTASGELILNPFHPYGSVKYLKNKPVTSFKEDDLYLRILEAKKEDLITFEMTIKPNVFRENCLTVITDAMFKPSTGPLADGWKAFREEIAREIFFKYFFPEFKKEHEFRIMHKAKNTILKEIYKCFWKLITVQPYKITSSGDGDDDVYPLVRICACCWGPGGAGKENTVLVALDAQGQLKDILFAPQFSGIILQSGSEDENQTGDVLEDYNKSSDARKICDFLMNHKPQLLVVGSAHFTCKQLLADLNCIRDHFLTDNARFIATIKGTLDIFLYSEMVARLWQNSPAAMSEFSGHPAIVRRAIALGRLLIDPLALIASLRDNNDTILSLPVCEMQSSISNEDRLNTIDKCLITVTSQVGVNINLVASIPWRSTILQFVPGLGPIKYKALLYGIRQLGNRIQARQDLSKILPPIVFKNVAGFIRVNDADLPALSHTDFDRLDDSRVHPDYYSVAKRFAALAVQYNDDEETVVQEAAENARSVQAINLFKFISNAIMINEESDDILSILIDIQGEILESFYDRRTPFSMPKNQDLFYEMANELPSNLRPGSFVQAIVTQVTADNVFCKFTMNNLHGVIKAQNFKSTQQGETIDLRQHTKKRDVIRSRILEVNMEEETAYLTCRQEDVDDLTDYYEKQYCNDPYYHKKTEEEKQQEVLEQIKEREQDFTTRNIKHKKFKNISKKKVEEKMTRIGAYIFRPYCGSYSYIHLTMKIFDGKYGPLFLHKDIREGNKPNTTDSYKMLGLPLCMQVSSKRHMSFKNLSEFKIKYVEPFMTNLKHLIADGKFFDGKLQDTTDHLQKEKLNNISRGVYCFCPDYSEPGTFFFANMTTHKVLFEKFYVVPNGYEVKGMVVKTVADVKNTYKKAQVYALEKAKREEKERQRLRSLHPEKYGDESVDGKNDTHQEYESRPNRGRGNYNNNNNNWNQYDENTGNNNNEQNYGYRGRGGRRGGRGRNYQGRGRNNYGRRGGRGRRGGGRRGGGGGDYYNDRTEFQDNDNFGNNTNQEDNMNQDNNINDGYNTYGGDGGYNAYGGGGGGGGNDNEMQGNDDNDAGPYPPPQENAVNDSDSDDCQFH